MMEMEMVPVLMVSFSGLYFSSSISQNASFEFLENSVPFQSGNIYIVFHPDFHSMARRPDRQKLDQVWNFVFGEKSLDGVILLLKMGKHLVSSTNSKAHAVWQAEEDWNDARLTYVT